MQCASSTTSSPTRSANSGSIAARNGGLLSRSGLISSTSTASASSGRAPRPRLLGCRVDRVRADPDPLGRVDLVAHEREQRRDDQRRARTAPRAAARSRGSRPPTCPSPCAARTARAAVGDEVAIASSWCSRNCAPGPASSRRSSAARSSMAAAVVVTPHDGRTSAGPHRRTSPYGALFRTEPQQAWSICCDAATERSIAAGRSTSRSASPRTPTGAPAATPRAGSRWRSPPRGRWRPRARRAPDGVAHQAAHATRGSRWSAARGAALVRA